MTVRYIQIETPDDIVKAWEDAPAVWRDIETNAIRLIMHGDPKKGILSMTPLANAHRYKYRTTTATHRKGEQNKRIVPGNLRRNFSVTVSGNVTSVGFKAGTGLQYANYQHERYDPSPAYWTPGAKRGWSTPGTTSKFVERPLTTMADLIPEQVGKEIDRRLIEGGL